MSKHVDTSRRTFLKVVSVSAGAASVSGTTGTAQMDDTDDGLNPDEEWPNSQYDAAHTGYNPTASGSKSDVETTNIPLATGCVEVEDTYAPVVGDGAVFYSMKEGDASTESQLRAWDYTDKKNRWSKTFEESVSRPTVGDGVVCVITSEYSEETFIRGFSTDDGSELWSTTVEGDFSHPVITDGIVYVINATGAHALNANDGTEKWHTQMDIRLDDGVVAPAVTDDSVYFTTWLDGLYALDVETGEQQWTFDAGAEGAVFDMTPTVANGTLIVGDRERYLYALDADDGSEQWRFENGAVAGWPSVAVANGKVYVGDAIGVG
ncbi:PQQ-binding-like beta-propeller repeat protein [Haladaptatus pallidirubidus]|nr:PQQ-binding-like beta-propeller repeat protein [Haladaptatus pallidirubidus]